MDTLVFNTEITGGNQDSALRKVTSLELHFFCDASQYAYAAVAYLKMKDDKTAKISVVTVKARVAPQATIPRLELSAAVLAARMYQTVIEEMQLENTTPLFWTDSMCVLRYI